MEKIKVQLHRKNKLIKFEFTGFLSVQIMLDFKESFKKAVASLDEQDFRVLCFLKTAFKPEEKKILDEVQVWARNNGLYRSAVVAPICQVIQMRRLAKKTGIDETERYFVIENYKKDEVNQWLFS